MDCCNHEVEQQELEYMPEDCEITLDPILIATDNLENVCFDEKQFQKGLNDISYVCGQITGLVNVSVSVIDALNYLTNIDVLKNNIQVSEINKDASIKTAKETAVQVEKNSL